MLERLEESPWDDKKIAAATQEWFTYLSLAPTS